jgi:endonuclease/exonuclease/phosphatase family metal-dependent hydrolase
LSRERREHAAESRGASAARTPSQPTSATPAPDRIRVASWNLWWCFGDWRDRLPRILRELSELNADVTGLQETWVVGEREQAEELATQLGLYWAWVPSTRPERWQERIPDPTDPARDALVGNAVLSRWPILTTSSEVLPVGAGREEGRSVLGAEIDARGGVLPFFTTQLNSNPAHSATRVQQATALARLVHGRTADAGDYPPVLCGDFNAMPDSDEMRLLEGHLTAGPVPDRVLVNAWRYYPGPPPPTWDPRNPYVAATFEPPATIDHMFVGPPRTDGRGRVVRVARFASDPSGGDGWASDHAGVVVDLGA